MTITITIYDSSMDETETHEFSSWIAAKPFMDTWSKDGWTLVGNDFFYSDDVFHLAAKQA